MKILIVDDAEIMLLLMQKFIATLGHQTLLARDGQQAIEAYIAEKPDLILMDMMMPVLDGPEAARRIKLEAGDRWVPIVFITAIGEESQLADAIEQGADDYLLKPINFRILEAKIKAIQRSIDLHHKVREQSVKLADYYERAEDEKRVARHLMEQMVNADRLADPALTYSIAAAESLSGDLIAAARTPGYRLHIMLADGIGHGLTAALNVLPLTQPFYTMTEKGFSIPELLAEMNTKVRQVLPVGRFVAVALAAIDPSNGVIEVWNGGMPDIVLFDAKGNVSQRWKSHHLPLGILSPSEFDARTSHASFDADNWLFMCSDGLIEARREDRQVFGADPILNAFAENPGIPAFERIERDLQAFMGGQAFHDDVSLALVHCTREDPASVPNGHAKVPFELDSAASAGWRYSVRLGPNELRRCSVVPLLMEFIKQIDFLKASQSEVFLILSELFNNALDHGLLNVESTLKQDVDGMDDYLRLRAERLDSLLRGEIEIELSQLAIQGRPSLRVRVKDSGAGFDIAALESAQRQAVAVHGRGVMLVKSLAASMQYIGNGSEVVVYFMPGQGG